MTVSIFPLQEMMIICKCGNERRVPKTELDGILSVEDLERFTKGRIMKYACRCGATKCDIQMRMSKEAEEDVKTQKGQK